MISVWVSPSAGEVVPEAITVEALADGAEVANVTVGFDMRVTLSVVSVAVNVTLSATESVNEKDTRPSGPVIAWEGAPTTALPEEDRLTPFPATGLLVDVSSVTTTVVPCEPRGAGVEAVTLD